MSREAYVDSSFAASDTIEYTNTAAVSEGEVIHVAGIGAMVATAAYAADAKGVYLVKGGVEVPLTAAVTATQGAKIYWDKSENTAILSSSTSLDTSAGDFYLGRAIAAGSAAGGYVKVFLDNGQIDNRGLGRSVPAAVCIEHGLQTCVNVTLVTNATLETILLTQVLTTDTSVVSFADVPDGDATSRVIWAKCNVGSVTVGLNTPVKSSAPTTRLAFRVFRAI